jgi:hypothetical protein
MLDVQVRSLMDMLTPKPAMYELVTDFVMKTTHPVTDDELHDFGLYAVDNIELLYDVGLHVEYDSQTKIYNVSGRAEYVHPLVIVTPSCVFPVTGITAFTQDEDSRWVKLYYEDGSQKKMYFATQDSLEYVLRNLPFVISRNIQMALEIENSLESTNE